MRRADVGLAASATATRSTINVPDAYEDPRFDRGWDEWRVDALARQNMVTPAGSADATHDRVQVRVDGGLEFHGDSAFQPMNPDRSIMTCSDYPFHSKYVFSPDLASLTCSSCTNCVSAAPCPD